MLQNFDNQFLGFMFLNSIVLANAFFIVLWLQKYKLEDWGKAILSVFVVLILLTLLTRLAGTVVTKIENRNSSDTGEGDAQNTGG